MEITTRQAIIIAFLMAVMVAALALVLMGEL